ncbi:TetR/AcrR family transcriptional regulator [Tindallia californiensis]|uniref:DNA-binding transcriptional regulator, AcrR family n=1 Tax=Tindallia californiensis TaxID=159292 RepID=A0A1H3K7Q6_9FIRM|nr:TetR/AcrR family transcriptional regulator [Tindallia californiensis]SDY48153.1 DNA-binding transcriptional regulator, AcrR family [Tindallia californiensis]
MSKKQEIIDRTYELFSRYGDALSLSAIANATSIKKSSLYAHFDSKDHLLFHVIDLELQKFDQATLDVLKTSDSTDLKKTVSDFYYFILYYFNDPTKLVFWKRCMLMSEGPLKKKVEETHMKIHQRNIEYITTLYIDYAKTNDLDEKNVDIFRHSFMVLLLGTLYSLFVFEHRVTPYDHSFHIFWKGVQQHLHKNSLSRERL